MIIWVNRIKIKLNLSSEIRGMVLFFIQGSFLVATIEISQFCLSSLIRIKKGKMDSQDFGLLDPNPQKYAYPRGKISTKNPKKKKLLTNSKFTIYHLLLSSSLLLLIKGCIFVNPAFNSINRGLKEITWTGPLINTLFLL